MQGVSLKVVKGKKTAKVFLADYLQTLEKHMAAKPPLPLGGLLGPHQS